MGGRRIRVPRKEAEALLRGHLGRGVKMLEDELGEGGGLGDDLPAAVETWFHYGADLVGRIFSSGEEARRLERLGGRGLFALTRRGRRRKALSLLRSGVGQLRLLMAALDRYEEPGGARRPVRGRAKAKAIIVHGPSAIAAHKLRSFVSALGLEAVTLPDLPGPRDDPPEGGRAQCVIVLAGAEVAEDGTRMARRELLESFRAARRITRNVICLLEDGAKLPPDAGIQVDARFRPESMDEAFTVVAERLRRDGLVGSQGGRG